MAFTSAEPSQARALFLHFYPLEEFKTDPSASASTGSNTTTEIDEKITSIEDQKKQITSQADLDALADIFTSAIFPTGEKERVGGKEGSQVSMAALQGYLLQYKEDPVDAAEKAAEWALEMSSEPKKTAKAVKPKKKTKAVKPTVESDVKSNTDASTTDADTVIDTNAIINTNTETKLEHHASSDTLHVVVEEMNQDQDWQKLEATEEVSEKTQVKEEALSPVEQIIQ